MEAVIGEPVSVIGIPCFAGKYICRLRLVMPIRPSALANKFKVFHPEFPKN